jgi:hypothetical protein
MATVLVAAPALVCKKLESVLAKRARVLCAEEFDEAVRLVREETIDLLVLCYVFDDVRPYRLLNHLQEHGIEKITTVLVRVLPVPLQESETQVEEAYQQLGVTRFVNLADAERREGEVALVRFGDEVLRLLRGANVTPLRPRAETR